MTNCPICNREILEDCLWCKDCSSDCENSTIDVYDDDLAAIAEWAADRAREFERDRAKVLIEALEKISKMYDEDEDPKDWHYITCATKALEEYRKE